MNELNSSFPNPQPANPRPLPGETTGRRPSRRLLWWALLAIGLAGGVVWMMLPVEEAPAEAQTVAPVKVRPHVSVVTSAPYGFNAGQDVAGLLAARNDISIGTAVTGQRIVEVFVDVGDTVAAGQLWAGLQRKTRAAMV